MLPRRITDMGGPSSNLRGMVEIYRSVDGGAA